MEFVKQFKAARHVSTPLVNVRTFDAKSTQNLIRKQVLTKEQLPKTPLLVWDAVTGCRGMNDAGCAELTEWLTGTETEQGVTTVLVEALKLAGRARGDVILFVCNAHLALMGDGGKPNLETLQGIWNLRDDYKANGNMLVLLTAPGFNLPAELVNDVLVLDEPLPTVEQLQAVVMDAYKSAKIDAGPDAETLQKATNALIGLPAFPADQSTAMCLDDKTGKLDTSELWSRKRQVISQTPGCSVYEGTETLKDVAGLESVVNFLRKRMSGKNPPKALLFMDEVEKAFAGTGTDMSGVKTELTGAFCSWFDAEKVEGVQFIGVPGVSKSALAKALGNEYGIPLIIYDLAGMQSSLVGSSGANLRAAQKVVSAISEGRLLVISTCNGVDSLPPEIRRRLGSLGIFFFDTPTDSERSAIWKLYRDKYSIPAEFELPACDGWTGAEIKECCRKADIFGMTLEESSSYVVPVTRSAADRIKALRLTSSGKYLSASKPGVYTFHETADSAPVKPVDSVTGRKIRTEVA